MRDELVEAGRQLTTGWGQVRKKKPEGNGLGRDRIRVTTPNPNGKTESTFRPPTRWFEKE